MSLTQTLGGRALAGPARASTAHASLAKARSAGCSLPQARFGSKLVTASKPRKVLSAGVRASSDAAGDLWMPPQDVVHGLPGLDSGDPSGLTEIIAGAASPAAVAGGGGYDEHRPKTPPPDLPSLLLDSRIIYLGMPLVPAVTELLVAEILYLQYKDRTKPMYMYINSTGCSRADGETVGFETEATAIYDTMMYVGNEIHTVGVGAAIGQACMLLAAGHKGNRYMMPHATAMLHQPRVPSTGQRQAIELAIKWKEVLAQKKTYVDILSFHTGHSVEKLDRDMQRPLYMQPKDAVAYGVIDKMIAKGVDAIDEVKGGSQWDKEAGLVQREQPGAGGQTASGF